MKRALTLAESAAIIWGSVAVASVLSAVLTSARLPSLIDVVIGRPLTVLAIALACSIVASVILRMRFEVLWSDVVQMVPFALLIGVVISWLGVWNDGSGTPALRLQDAGLFLVTLGILPFKLGPEVFMRATAVALCVLVTLHLFRQNTPQKMVGKAALGMWLSSAVILLLQTWMAHWSALAQRVTIDHSQDAVRALSILHANSYWSTFQAERFFSGIEQQLDTAVTLSSASIVFLLAIILALVVRRRDNWPMLRIPSIPYALLAAPFLGIIIGWPMARWSWNVLDIVAILLLGLFLASWFFWNAFDHLELFLLVFVISGVLLGWPILLLGLALVAVRRLAGGTAWLKHGLHGAIFVCIGGVFMARSALFPQTIGYWALGAGILTAILAWRQGRGGILPAARQT